MSNYEYNYFDGEYFHTLNLVGLNQDSMVATVAVTYAGGISVKDFDLLQDESGLYCEYGPLLVIIHIEDFEIVE